MKSAQIHPLKNAKSQFLTKTNWPPDFLVAYGLMEDHGGSSLGWAVTALPPELFVRIAVIENTGGAGATYNVSGISAKRSKRSDLRTVVEDSAEIAEQLHYPPSVFSRGDKIVIPVSAEVRPNATSRTGLTTVDISPSDPASKLVLAKLSAVPGDTILVTQNPVIGNIRIRKSKTVFSSPVAPHRETYVTGVSYDLESITVDGQRLPLRAFDPNYVFFVAGFLGGSCPTLYVKRLGEDEFVKIGNIIRDAQGPDREKIEEIDLGSGVEGFLIAEQEVERTSVKSVRVFEIDQDGGRHLRYSSQSGTVLNFGEHTFGAIENSTPASKYLLEVTGFYEPWVYSTITPPVPHD